VIDRARRRGGEPRIPDGWISAVDIGRRGSRISSLRALGLLGESWGVDGKVVAVTLGKQFERLDLVWKDP
jgi:hypothetical protein